MRLTRVANCAVRPSFAALSSGVRGESQPISVRIGDQHFARVPRRVFGRLGDGYAVGDEVTMAFVHVGHHEVHRAAHLGEAGGLKEYRAAEVVEKMTKPVVALVVGRHAPAGKRMGHVGAIVMGTMDAAAPKAAALRAAGAHVVSTPWEIANAIAPLVASASVTRP